MKRGTVLMGRPRCPDGGACHHSCRPGPCFRVQSCGPLSVAGFPEDAWPPIVVELHAIIERMVTFADDLDSDLECTTPAYGVPGHAHCAACCYGTGRIITNASEGARADAADALRRSAAIIRAEADDQARLNTERAW